METREILYSDKTVNQITTFRGKENIDITLICLPAMGVRASYYELFAATLCRQGFNVIIADWRGQGKSSVRASRAIDFGYEEIIRDIKELIEYAEAWFPGTKKIIVGHSLGGQIGSLFASRYSKVVSGLILITSCSVYYKGWNKWNRIKLRLAGNIFYPLSKIIGHFPGDKIGFGGREARAVIKDWCHNALYGEYKLSNSKHDYETSLKKLNTHVLSISIESDPLASKQAVENLYKKFSAGSAISHLHLTSDETKISPLDHFSWTKDPDYFVGLVKNWIGEIGNRVHAETIQGTTNSNV